MVGEDMYGTIVICGAKLGPIVAIMKSMNMIFRIRIQKLVEMSNNPSNVDS